MKRKYSLNILFGINTESNCSFNKIVLGLYLEFFDIFRLEVHLFIIRWVLSLWVFVDVHHVLD